MSTFSLKTIQLEITLGKGVFSEGGNTKIIEGLACEVSIEKPGQPEKNSANINVWGLKLEDMAQLTMLSFKPLEYHKNTITVRAGVQGEELSVAFSGDITHAFADFNSAPDVSMCFEASTAFYAQQIAQPMITINGEANAADVIAQEAKKAGFTLQIDKIPNIPILNACFSGSPIEKITRIATDLGLEVIIDDGQIIILPPKGEARTLSATLLTKDTGMIGYPTFTQNGISLKCFYNPELLYGGLVQVESIVPRASGVWKITKLSHSLSAYTSSAGAWESELEAVYFDGQ